MYVHKNNIFFITWSKFIKGQKKVIFLCLEIRLFHAHYLFIQLENFRITCLYYDYKILTYNKVWILISLKLN